MKNTGSISGLKKDTQFANCAIYQATAKQSLSALKTIGLIDCPKNEQDLINANI